MTAHYHLTEKIYAPTYSHHHFDFDPVMRRLCVSSADPALGNSPQACTRSGKAGRGLDEPFEWPRRLVLIRRRKGSGTRSSCQSHDGTVLTRCDCGSTAT